MADDATPPVDPPADPPEDPPADPPADPPEDEPFDKDRAMATIRKQREEAKALRVKAKEADELRTRIQAIEDAEKTDLERAQTKIAELEAAQSDAAAARQETLLKLAVYTKAPEVGIIDADIALALLDRSAIEYDDKGEPSNLDDQLTALLEAKPILKGKAVAKPPKIDGSDGTGKTPPPPLTSAELEMAAKLGMTPERYNAMKTVETFEGFDAMRKSESAAA